jgi:hypothetical protein
VCSALAGTHLGSFCSALSRVRAIGKLSFIVWLDSSGVFNICPGLSRVRKPFLSVRTYLGLGSSVVFQSGIMPFCGYGSVGFSGGEALRLSILCS